MSTLTHENLENIVKKYLADVYPQISAPDLSAVESVTLYGEEIYTGEEDNGLNPDEPYLCTNWSVEDFVVSIVQDEKKDIVLMCNIDNRSSFNNEFSIDKIDFKKYI
jgi:hypothetical protein